MRQLIAAAALLTFGLLPGLSQPLAAEPGKTIAVKDAWLRATPNGAKVAGGYVTITNSGTAPDRLIGAGIPSAPSAEVHSMTMENGMMHMARMADGLPIAPGAAVTLKPGGYHLMFMNPSAPLKEGETVAGSLTFEKAGTVPVTFVVGGMAAKTAPGAMKMDGMDMSGMDHGHMDMGGMKMDGTKPH